MEIGGYGPVKETKMSARLEIQCAREIRVTCALFSCYQSYLASRLINGFSGQVIEMQQIKLTFY